MPTRTHTHPLPFIALLRVGVSLPSVGGAAALCYTSTAPARIFPTTVTLTAAAVVSSPVTFFCHSCSLGTMKCSNPQSCYTAATI